MATPEPNGSAFDTLQQAAEWFAILQNAPSPAEREAWRLWLHSRPEHAAAWARVEAISRPFHTLPDEACRQAAGVALRTSLTRRQHLKMLALLCGSGALSYAGLRQAPWNVWGATLRTGVGEMREERLADASRVWLNTDTALDVDFAGAQRRLTLHRGELLVELAADPRPLLLQSLQGAVNATTARFSLRLDPDIGRLAVYAGSVELVTPQGVSQRLGAGQGWRFGGSLPGRRLSVSGEREVAWSHGMLLADDMRLGDFVVELARYRRGYLGCAPQVADLRLVGAFPLADTGRVLRALAETLPVRIHRPLPWWVSIEPRTA